ncbi:MAG: ribosomal protein S18-alanine N-acetyltransferase [Pseudomonadota bacterium]|nr:ribosomal protein S18-alanine N-acetyltransferase [Pseudomonadota bacterium]
MSAVIQDPDFVLRPMRDLDIPAVMAVETLAYAHPWTEGIFRDCLRVGYSCWVMARAKEIVGYGVMSVAAGECHVLNLCVRADWQGRQIGRKMLRRLLSIGRTNNADTAFLEVRVSNRSAIGLYEAEGFCEVGVRRGYYPADNGREDAAIMARPL